MPVHAPRKWLLLSLLPLVGCIDESASPTGPKPELQAPTHAVAASAQIADAVKGRKDRGIEDDILRLESAVPGLGGLFVDDAGAVTIYLPRNADKAKGRSAIARIASSLNVTPDVRKQLLAAAGPKFRDGDYAFSDLVAWQAAIAAQITPRMNVFGVDADESKNRVRILVTGNGTVQEARQLAEKANVPQAAITVETGNRPAPVGSLRGTFRPTAGGVQWSSGPSSGFNVCTMGFNVIAANGTKGFLSASHCSYTGPGTTGGTANQPIPGLPVGTDWINPPWNSTDPACSGYSSCTAADAMFVKYSDVNTWARRVAFTDFAGLNNAGGSITVTGYWTNVVSPASPAIGQALDKLGRLTGWTRGTLNATCVNVYDVSSAHICSDVTIKSRVGQGDSGGPIFIPPPSGQVTQPLYPVGILWGQDPARADSYDSSNNAWFCTGANGDCLIYYSNWSKIQTTLGTTFTP